MLSTQLKCHHLVHSSPCICLIGSWSVGSSLYPIWSVWICPFFFFTRKSCCYKRWCHLPERKQIVLLCQLSLLATTVHAALTFRVFTPSIPFHIVGLTYRSTRLCQGKEEAKRQCGNSKQRNLYIEEILFKSHCNLNPTGLDGAGLGLWFYFLLMTDKLEQAGLSGPAGNMGSWSLLPT